MSLVNGHRLFAETLFISPDGDRIAACGSQSFLIAGGTGGCQDEFTRRRLEPGEGGKAVVGGGSRRGLHFSKKKVWGGVWFGLVSVKNALDYHAHREFSTPLSDIE